MYYRFRPSQICKVGSGYLSMQDSMQDVTNRCSGKGMGPVSIQFLCTTAGSGNHLDNYMLRDWGLDGMRTCHLENLYRHEKLEEGAGIYPSLAAETRPTKAG